jgi:FkbM family methyltransferase
MTEDEVIRALYETLLLRAPDAEGLNEKLEALVTGRENISDVMRRIMSSPEFTQVYPILLSRYVRQPRFMNDVSQNGEIGLLLTYMINDAATHGIVVDVGAGGIGGSNSYDLLRVFGWRGLLIEANPALIDALRRDFADFDVQIINCAVSNYNGTALFYIGVNNDVSSLQQNAALGWGPIQGTVDVTVRRLSEILQEYIIPFDFDLLSLDIEGEDIAVFNDLVESGYRPRWVIIEVSFSSAILGATRTLHDAPFSPQVRDCYALIAQTEPNLILKLRH